MNNLIDLTLQPALLVLVAMLLPLGYRVMRAPTRADRLQALDAITAVLLGIIVILGVLQGLGMLLDIAIALAAFAFVATVGIARYLAEEKMF